MARDLETIWKQHGIHRLRREFYALARKNKTQALSLINDETVSFPVLFSLIPEIEGLGLLSALRVRNVQAVMLCRNLGKKKDFTEPDIDCLNWIFTTGGAWEGSDTHCGAVIDYCAAELITNYNQKHLLLRVLEIMFRRNRKGQYIHDLAWVFFRVLHTGALADAAEYLLSENEKDTRLACKLLCLEPKEDKRQMYNEYLRWLEENHQLLHLSGEHFGASSQPAAFIAV